MLVAVYGTLRKECPLNYMLMNSLYLGEEELDGFELYVVAGLPMADYGNGKLKVDVYDVPPDVFFDIDYMERSSGYFPEKVATRHGVATIWLNRMAKIGERIKDGDYKRWLQWNSQI